MIVTFLVFFLLSQTPYFLIHPPTLPFYRQRKRNRELEWVNWGVQRERWCTESHHWCEEQHGRKPDTWGHFHFLCQLRQTATSTAEENISHSFSYTHTLHFLQTSSQPDHATLLPSTQTICYSFKSWISGSLAWWRWQHDIKRPFNQLHSVSKTCFAIWKEWGKVSRSKIWLVFAGGCCQQNFFTVSKFVLHVGCLSPKLPQNFFRK